MDYDEQRAAMIEEQLQGRDIYDFRVLDTMRRVPRHEFVPESARHMAYQDRALAIGHQQTISQPYIVALMLQLAQLSGHELVLEIGTGSGYQTALLCELAAYVYSVERNKTLGRAAATLLAAMEYDNVDVHIGDGSQGLPDMSPFDVILVTACVPSIPGPLKAQLQPQNGRLILPVGNRDQQFLQVVKRDFDRWIVEKIIPVRFVPLVGRYGFRDR